MIRVQSYASKYIVWSLTLTLKAFEKLITSEVKEY